MKNPDNKQRLVKVMQRLDKTFKTQLNEEFDAGTDDPTKEEMVGFLHNEFRSMNLSDIDFDIAAAIYWFSYGYHGGQNSNLYSALSTSDYRPGPMHKSIKDDESETATMMYNELVNKYGGSAKENPIGEVFGWSGKEKETKLNQQQINNAKAEIAKYPPSHLFGQPGRNSTPADNKQLMNVRLNMAKQYMPILAELMPQLFDLTQAYNDMVRIYNGKPLKGLVPSNWYYFLRGGEGYVDNEQAVRKLNQEIDALGQKMGVRENEYVDTSMNEYKYPDNSETYTKLLNTAQEEGHITSHERTAQYIDATAKEIATEFDNLHLREQDVFWDSYYKKFLKKIKKINEQGFKTDIKNKSIQEEILPDNPKEYKYKTEKIKQKIDMLFNNEEYDLIETMYRLIVERKKPIVSELNEELI